MSLSAGAMLGPYEILGAIGAGGMGEVYKARDTRLDRTVAVKISAEQFSERFDREARAVAALNHPNICTLHDVGPNYLVMEYIEGPTLAERIRGGAIPPAEALPIARQIAEAIEAAHEKGIVHRDLKPANIKFTADGKVKVLDFGLAKAFEGDSANPADSPTLTLAATRAGVILGTAGYMSPEQARGTPADKRADIWSYGVMMFEMLTGHHTFTGETISDTLAAVLRADLDWNLLPLDTPAAIRRLLRRCLERDRKKRLRDIGDALLEIDAAPESVAAPPAQAREMRHTRRWAIAVALPTLAALILAFVNFRRPAPSEPPVQRFQIPLSEKTSFTGRSFAISPDSRRLAYPATGADGRTMIWIRPLDSLEARPLAGSENAWFPFWSPDSRFLGYWADGKLKRIDAAGGPSETVCDAANAAMGTWNQAGIIIFGEFGKGLSRVSAAGGTVTTLTKPDSQVFHVWPVFLPDGKHFLYFAGGIQQGDLHIAELDSGLQVKVNKKLVASRQGPAFAPSPDPEKGRLLFLREGTLMTQTLDIRRMEVTGDAVPVAEQVGSYLTTGFFSASSTGVLVYRKGGGAGTQLQWFDRQGKSLGVAAPVGMYYDVALSPDGTRVTGMQLGGTDLWLTDLGRGVTSRFTFQSAGNQHPVWSPDGAQIAFTSHREAIPTIYRKISSGAGNEVGLLPADVAKYANGWSRDGRYLLYTIVDPKTGMDLWVLPDPGGAPGAGKPRPYLQTTANETMGQFSPDSHWVAYVSNESGRPEVFVQPFPAAGGKWQLSSGGGTQPRWRADGKELFYVSPDFRLMSVEVKTGGTFEAGLPKALFLTRIFVSTDPHAFRYSVAADGKRFLIDTVGSDESSASPFTVVLNWKAGRQ